MKKQKTPEKAITQAWAEKNAVLWPQIGAEGRSFLPTAPRQLLTTQAFFYLSWLGAKSD